VLGRGPGDSRESHVAGRDGSARDDARWSDREREDRARETDPREVFTRYLNLPRAQPSPSPGTLASRRR
jgi:hypothetical protein